jgi:hypothetical protein
MYLLDMIGPYMLGKVRAWVMSCIFINVVVMFFLFEKVRVMPYLIGGNEDHTLPVRHDGGHVLYPLGMVRGHVLYLLGMARGHVRYL